MFFHVLPPDAALTRYMRELFVLGLRGFRVEKQIDQTRIGMRWKDSLLDCMLRFLVTVPLTTETAKNLHVCAILTRSNFAKNRPKNAKK